jgi:hypothetical protein
MPCDGCTLQSKLGDSKIAGDHIHSPMRTAAYCEIVRVATSTGGGSMPEKHVTRWEREFHEQAVEAELFLAGQRAGAAVARSDWPKVERARQQVLSKGDQAARIIFGNGSAAAGSSGYRAGWVEGYSAYCAELDRLESARSRSQGSSPAS